MPLSEQDAQDRQLTALRQRLGQWKAKTINKIQHILLKHNLEQECPTKVLRTKKARQWLAEVPLNDMDRLEMDQMKSANTSDGWIGSSFPRGRGPRRARPV